MSAVECIKTQVIPQTITKEESLIFDPSVLNQKQVLIPQEFVWPDHDESSQNVPALEVPLIDIAARASEEACRLISEAGKHHGFFLVTNHGVDESLLARSIKFMDIFFDLPLAEKRKAQRTWGESSGFASSFVGRFQEELPWKETLSFRFCCEDITIKEYISKKMGQGFEEFGSVYQEYAEAMFSLALKIMEILGASLGVDKNHFREFYEDNDSIFRLNYYPPCKQPDLALGTGPHCDPNSLTILHQDQVGGLQVLVDDEWRSIPPNPKALVVNIGDTFMALTNGKYKSCVHRAMVNRERARKSLTFFMSPKADKVVRPPKELIGDKRAYHDFTWEKFLEFTQKQCRVDKTTIEKFAAWLENGASGV